MLQLTRADWQIEVAAAQWAGMIAFLAESGWRPGVPAFVPGQGEAVVDDAHAKHFAGAGEIVLEETLKDPLSAYATITFDMGKIRRGRGVRRRGQVHAATNEPMTASKTARASPAAVMAMPDELTHDGCGAATD